MKGNREYIATFSAMLCVALASRLAAAGAPEDHFRSLARDGTNDLLRHFWTGDEKTGHIAP